MMVPEEGTSEMLTIHDKELHAAARRDEIQHKIESRFQRAATFDARNVDVQVHGSEVTLRGNVSSLREKDAAYYTAWNTVGVSAVNNLLTVGLSYVESPT